MVSIRQGDNWIPLESIQLVGEIAYTDVAISIPEKFITDETIELKLSTGFKFWELDAMYMDFSEPGEFTVTAISPSKVVGNENFLSYVLKDDQTYMTHALKGDSAIVEFTELPKANRTRSLFLHSKGYYISTEEYDGKTEWKTLAAIRKASGLSNYSRALFEYYSNAARK
jgi:hypothetical protein